MSREQLRVIRTLLQLTSIFRYQTTVLNMPLEDQRRILSIWKDLESICTMTREQVLSKLCITEHMLRQWNDIGYLVPLPPSFGEQERYISTDVEIIGIIEGTL